MKFTIPKYELKNVYKDGNESKPKIIPITELPFNIKMKRRGFLGAGITTIAALTMIRQMGCKSSSEPTSPQDPENKEETVNVFVPAPMAHVQSVDCMAFHKEGSLLVSGGFQDYVKGWAIPDAFLINKSLPKFNYVWSLKFSPDGTLLAGAVQTHLNNWKIYIWEIPSQKEIKLIEEYPKTFKFLEFSDDGKILFSLDFYSELTLWSIPDGNKIRSIEQFGNILAVSPDRKILATVIKKVIKLYSVPEVELIKEFNLSESGGINAMNFSPDGSLLIVGGTNETYQGIITIRTISDGKIIKVIQPESDALSIAISSDSKILASGLYDKSIKLWNIPDGSLIKTLKGHNSTPKTLAFSPDGKILASGSAEYEGAIILWESPNYIGKTFLFDVNASWIDATTYKTTNPNTGRNDSYTLPCGSPLPKNVTCTCNCVEGKAPEGGYGGSGGGCSCIPVCICIPVCQAHKVLSSDINIRKMAREILLLMGERHFDYLDWAAKTSGSELRNRIQNIKNEIKSGVKSDTKNWPEFNECFPYLNNVDRIVRIMAAQMIKYYQFLYNIKLNIKEEFIVNDLINEARVLYFRNKEFYTNTSIFD